jgi:hypothetical protein
MSLSKGAVLLNVIMLKVVAPLIGRIRKLGRKKSVLTTALAQV